MNFIDMLFALWKLFYLSYGNYSLWLHKLKSPEEAVKIVPIRFIMTRTIVKAEKFRISNFFQHLPQNSMYHSNMQVFRTTVVQALYVNIISSINPPFMYRLFMFRHHIVIENIFSSLLSNNISQKRYQETESAKVPVLCQRIHQCFPKDFLVQNVLRL